MTASPQPVAQNGISPTLSCEADKRSIRPEVLHLRESKASTAEAVDAFVEAVTAAVKGGEVVQLIGFGSFSTGARAERTGRNPKTGEAITIPAAKTVKFAAGKAFKDAVNGG